MVLLGDEDLLPEEVAQMAQQSLAGEMSFSVFEQKLKTGGAARLDDEQPRKRLAPGEAISGHWKSNKISNATLRLYGGEVNSKDGPITIDVYLNVGSDEGLSQDMVNYAGSFKRRTSDGKFIISFDITLSARQLIDSGDRVSATIVLADGSGSVSWEQAELAVFINERD